VAAFLAEGDLPADIVALLRTRPERHERGFAAGAVAGAYQHSHRTVSDRVTEDIDHTD